MFGRWTDLAEEQGTLIPVHLLAQYASNCLSRNGPEPLLEPVDDQRGGLHGIHDQKCQRHDTGEATGLSKY